MDDVKFAPIQNYVEGLDELAKALNVEPAELNMAGIKLRAKSGNCYSITELLVSHIQLMTECLEKTND